MCNRERLTHSTLLVCTPAIAATIFATVVVAEDVPETARSQAPQSVASETPVAATDTPSGDDPDTDDSAAAVMEPIATVGDDELTLSDLYNYARRNADRMRDFGTQEGRVRVLREIIENRLINQAAAQRAGLEGDYTTDALVKAVAALFASKEFKAKPVSDADVRAHYEAHRAELGIPAAVRIREIFFPVPAQADAAEREAVRDRAQAALERAKNGESLAALARELAHTDFLRQMAGEQPYLPLHLYPYLGDLTAKMSSGDLGPVVELPGGFQVFQLLGKRKGLSVPYEEVEAALRTELVEKSAEEQRQRFLSAYAKKVGVTIHSPAFASAWPDGAQPPEQATPDSSPDTAAAE